MKQEKNTNAGVEAVAWIDAGANALEKIGEKGENLVEKKAGDMVRSWGVSMGVDSFLLH